MLLKTSLLAMALFLWTRPITSYAQTKPSSETIGVDLGSATFTGTKGLPFDIPFIVEGNVSSTLRKVILSYRVKKGEVKKWMQFPKKAVRTNSELTMAFSDPVTWKQTEDFKAGQKFNLPIGPIHPNATYEFHFELIRSIDMTTDQNTAVKKKLLAVIYKFIDKITVVDSTDLANTNTCLNAILKQSVTPGAEIVEVDLTPFKLNLAGPVLQPIVSSIVQQNKLIQEFDERISPNCDEFSNSNYQIITAKLKALDKSTLDESSLAFYNAVVISGSQQFKEVKMPDVTALLLDSTMDICRLIKGTAKLEGARILSSDKFDSASLALLRTYFEKLRQLKDQDGGPVFGRNTDEILNLELTLKNATDEQNSLVKAKADRESQLADFPNVLENKLIALSFIVSDQSNMDVVSDANPYVGLDFGTAFIPSYNQLFIYEGVNFYFAPVNKDAPLSRFSGNFLNMLSKMVSIHIGLTQNVVKVENERYVPLINNVGSLLIGGGIRVNRIVRVNAGSMFFFQKDVNPLIDHKKLTSKFTASLTIDLNVAKALGNIGKRLKLNQ